MKKLLCNPLLIPALVLVLGAVWYGLLFCIDNQYNHTVPLESGRVLWQGTTDGPLFLVDGWEYYPGQLLAPEDFLSKTDLSPQVSLGEPFHFSDDPFSPYGTATYRLILENDGPARELAFYLPELFCAGRVYINGVLVGEQGSLSPYIPQVQDHIYSFLLEDTAEIVVQCANYSHYYSGMYYPPAVGSLQSIHQMLVIRLAVYGMLCFFTLALALLYLLHWVLGRDVRMLQMGLLSLCYALPVCYPFLQAMGLPFVRPLYVLEDVCGNLVLLFVVLMAGRLAGTARGWFPHRAAVFATAALCLFSLIFPAWVLSAWPDLISFYGLALPLWKTAIALYLSLLAGHLGVVSSLLNRYLLGVSFFFGLSEIVAVLFGNRFQPIYGPRPEEYGGFALVVGFAVMIIHQNLHLARENARLTHHLQEEVDRKTRDMERLLQERRELLANVLHDLKNPLAALCNYAELVRYGDVSLDKETEQYLNALSARAGAVRDRLHHLQDFSRAERGLSDVRLLCLTAFLRDFYNTNRPDMELSGVTFLLQLPRAPLFVRGTEERLRIALENLCYNALSFTPCTGTITLRLAREKEWAVISVQDTGCGIAPEEIADIFERGFTKRADKGGEGLGLFLVRAIALEHGGSVEVRSQPGEGSTFFLRLPLAPSPDAAAAGRANRSPQSGGAAQKTEGD